MKRAFSNILFAVIFLLLLSNLISAQTGKLTGVITDEMNGDVLPGANVMFDAFSIGAAADLYGKFTILGIPEGTHKLTVSYLGYEKKELEVTITANRMLNYDINLRPLVLEGEEVLVSAQASGQQQAINQQLTSKTIKNVVSKKQIQELPEANAAEAVGRLPGVSLSRNGGEGNKVIIRGMAPKYSLVQIDGVSMAATGNGDRSTDLSMISPYMLEGIELTKSVMANQEATATGGIVNFRIKKAPVGMNFNAIAQGGYNSLRSTYKDFKVSAGGSNRFWGDKLGVYAQFDFEEVDRSSHQLGSVQFEQDAIDLPVKTNSLQLMDIFRNLERIGATAVIDYSLPRTDIKSSNFFSRIQRAETRYTTTYGFEMQDFTIDYNDTPERSQTIMTNSLQLDHRFNDFEINMLLSHSYSEDDLPFAISSSNEGSPTNPFDPNRTSNYNVNLDPELIPLMLLNSHDENVKFMHLGGVSHNESLTKERDLAGELNFTYNFSLMDQISVKLSTGGKYRYKKKEYDRFNLFANNGGGSQEYRNLVYETFESEFSQRTKDAWAADVQRILLIDFLDKNYEGGDFLDGKYDFGNVFNKDMFRRLHDIVMAEYDPNSPISNSNIVSSHFTNSNYQDYKGNEEYYAFYLMPEISFGSKILFVPGVRFESNKTEYTGYRGNRFGIQRNERPTAIDTVTRVRANDFILPMIQLFYKPTNYLTIKAGYTNTLQRPNYNNIMPGWVIGTRGEIDNLSNIRLKPEKSENIDLQVSVHSDKIGLFSLGAFHKNIKDMIFWTGQRALLDTAYYEVPSLVHRKIIQTAINNPNKAENYGFEVEWQSNFWWLPGLLKGIVINFNYTRNYSEAQYPRTRIKTIIDPITYKATIVNEDTTYKSPLILQPDHLLNLTLGYDYEGFSIRGALRYTSGIFKNANWYEALRGFSDDFIRFDLSLRQKLPLEGMEVFLNVNNLTNEQEHDIISHMSFTRYREDYGRNANLGIRYQF